MAIEIRQRADEVRKYAFENWNALQSIVRLDEEGYQNFLSLFRSELTSLQDSFNLGAEAVSSEIALKTFFGVVNYCFVNPYSKKEYRFVKDGEHSVRSTGFYKALAFSKVKWNSPEIVLQLTTSDWFELLQTSSEDDLYQIEERFTRIQKFASYLITQNIFDVAGSIKSQAAASAILQLLIDSQLFEDAFLKRAQVTVSSIVETVRSQNQQVFTDIDQLTLMADYRIPQLLYNANVIRIVDSKLLSMLKNRTVISSESSYEIALRSSVIVIGTMLAKDIGITERKTDKVLWELSQQWLQSGKMPIPSMLVPTDKY